MQLVGGFLDTCCDSPNQNHPNMPNNLAIKPQVMVPDGGDLQRQAHMT